MKYYDALKIAAEEKGYSIRKVSREFGKAGPYIGANMTRGSLPKVDNASKLLEICGYKLCAVPENKVKDYMIVID